MYACFLQDPTGVVVPVDDSFAAGAYSGCQSVATAAAGTAAMVVAAAGVRASSTATDINWEEVVALGGDPSDEVSGPQCIGRDVDWWHFESWRGEFLR